MKLFGALNRPKSVNKFFFKLPCKALRFGKFKKKTITE